MDANLTWAEMGTEYLYHGTTATMAKKIMADGLVKGPSWWGTERMAEYYAETVSEEDDPEDEPAIIRIPLSRFDEGRLGVDGNSIAEPIAGVLGEREEALYARWKASRHTWRDCLRIYESVWYDAPMRVAEADIL